MYILHREVGRSRPPQSFSEGDLYRHSIFDPKIFHLRVRFCSCVKILRGPFDYANFQWKNI